MGRNWNKNSFCFFSSLQETSENHPMSLQFTSQLTFHLLGNYRRSRLFWRRGGRFPWWSAAPCLHSASRNKIEKYELKWKGNDVPRLYLVISCCHLSFHWNKITNGFKMREKEGFYTFYRTLALTLFLQSPVVWYVDSIKLFINCATIYNVTYWKVSSSKFKLLLCGDITHSWQISSRGCIAGQ